MPAVINRGAAAKSRCSQVRKIIKLTAQREAFHRRVQLLAGGPVRVVRLEAAVVQVQGLVPLPVDALVEQKSSQFSLRSRSIKDGKLDGHAPRAAAPRQSR